jgi:hypothetical protein
MDPIIVNPIIVNPIIEITNNSYNDNTSPTNVYQYQYMRMDFISNYEANIRAAEALEDWFMEAFGAVPDEATIQQLEEERHYQEQQMKAQQEQRRRLYALGMYELEDGEILDYK